ncbi:MAG: hypothetical protein PHE25_03110 [Candidatus Gracilibacteria bacterium]|nr:hypothetical protein [Candidatus Gracilibacteria bacterium]
MNIDGRKGLEGLTQSGIDTKINELTSEIEGKFNFKQGTLSRLFDFKFQIGGEEVKKDSKEFRNALLEEIKSKAEAGEITLASSEKISTEEYNILADRIISINKLTDDVKSGIDLLRADLLKDLKLDTKGMLTAKYYNPETLAKIDNPKNFVDHLEGLLVGTVETIAVLGKLGYDIGKGLVLAIYHLILLLRGKAKHDGVDV